MVLSNCIALPKTFIASLPVQADDPSFNVLAALPINPVTPPIA